MRKSAIDRFLAKNTVSGVSGNLPVTHSTAAYFGKKIIYDGAIEPRSCQYFEGEKLVYLFYGRPSYKRITENPISKFWQLPMVFLFDFDVASYKRIFPFDTGAFKSNLYPDFFNMMPLEEYSAIPTEATVQKMVSAFFVDASRYFKLSPRSDSDFKSRFDIMPTDEEIQALYDLVSSHTSKVDDRRFAIELQTANRIDLRKSKLDAIIMPEEYLESKILLRLLRGINESVEILSYPSYPLKQEMYYMYIYNSLFEFYRHRKYVR